MKKLILNIIYLLLLPSVSHGAVTAIFQGGTGTGTFPVYGKVLVGNAAGNYDYVSTSTFPLFAAVSSVFARTGAVVAQAGDYTTTLVAEGTNLYFTVARVLSALTGQSINTSNVNATSTITTSQLLSGSTTVGSLTATGTITANTVNVTSLVSTGAISGTSITGTGALVSPSSLHGSSTVGSLTATGTITANAVNGTTFTFTALNGPSATIGSGTFGALTATTSLIANSGLIGSTTVGTLTATGTITANAINGTVFTGTATSSFPGLLASSSYINNIYNQGAFAQNGLGDCTGTNFMQYTLATGKLGCAAASAGSQTPWAQNIAGAGFGLNNASYANITGSSTINSLVAGSSTVGVINATSTTATSTFANFEGHFWITAPDGVDFGQKVTQAYVRGFGSLVVVHVPKGIYTQAVNSFPINASTTGKRLLIVCDPADGTVINLTGVGTSTIWNGGSGGTPGLLHTGFGENGCTTNGSNTTGQVGWEIGGSNGAEGFTARDSSVFNTDKGIVLGNNLGGSGVLLDNIRSQYNNYNFVTEFTSNAGEGITVTNSNLSDCQVGFTSKCIYLKSTIGASIDFMNDKMDDATFYSADGNLRVNIIGGQMENPNQILLGKYNFIYYNTGGFGSLNVSGVAFVNDATTSAKSPTQYIMCGGNCSVSNNSFANVGAGPMVPTVIATFGTGVISAASGNYFQNSTGTAAFSTSTSVGFSVDPRTSFVGIGTSSPRSGVALEVTGVDTNNILSVSRTGSSPNIFDLDVQDTKTRERFYTVANDRDLYFDSDTAGTNRLFINGTNGNVGVGGSTTPWARLSIQATDALATSYVIAASDNNSGTLFSVADDGTTRISATSGAVPRLNVGTTTATSDSGGRISQVMLVVNGNQNDFLSANVENDHTGPCATAEYDASNNIADTASDFAAFGQTGSGFTGFSSGTTPCPFTAYPAFGADAAYVFSPSSNINYSSFSTTASHIWYEGNSGGQVTTAQERMRLDANGYLSNMFSSATSTKKKTLSDPDNIPVIATSNIMATYSDDMSRALVCSTAAAGNIQIRNNGLVNASQLYSGTTAQTITWTALLNSVAVGRGCLTYQGYHYVMYASTTNAAFTAIRRATSSDYVDNSVSTNWSTSTISGVAFTVNDFLVGATGNTLYVATSTTAIGKYTIATSTNTLTYAGTITLASTNVLINNTRVNDNGIYAGFSAAPFTRKMTLTGVLVPGMNIGVAVPATTGPDMFVTRNSLYGLYGNSASTLISQIVGF